MGRLFQSRPVPVPTGHGTARAPPQFSVVPTTTASSQLHTPPTGVASPPRAPAAAPPSAGFATNSPSTPRILGKLLVTLGQLSERDLQRALEAQRGSGKRLGELLISMGLVGAEAVAKALATQLSLPYERPPLTADTAAVALLRGELAKERSVLPLSVSARRLRLAMLDPLDLATVDDVRFQTGKIVEAVVASSVAISEGLHRAYGVHIDKLLEQLPVTIGSEREGDDRALEEVARSAPVVQLVDHVLERAIEENASDIHIEEHGGDVRVRYRLDGLLREALELPRATRRAVLSRIKIMAGMDISVKRRPQDGGIGIPREGRKITIRVSTLPVNGGEKAVCRILDPHKAPSDLGRLGLAPNDLKRLRALIKGGQGVILTAGPTGSGKSSTLYGALQEVDRSTRNVVTLEDPIEYRLMGANQVQVDPKAGLTFPAALRSVLRQDPDVVMVGEIRDRETAEIAMAAAITGHLVLSTIHTTDAPSAISRLLNMGVPPFLVAGGLAGVVAQRLVRKVCGSCLGRRADGCGRCREGYSGRTGVFQVLVMTDAMREEVLAGSSTATLRRLAQEAGMGSMIDDVRRKVAEGVTTPHEAGRVLHSDPGAALPCKACGGETPQGAGACPHCGASRTRRCACGQTLQPGWRYCAWCVRPVRKG
jgi:type IV pilus assembly protein PilB